jgi:hypothetical protein
MPLMTSTADGGRSLIGYAAQPQNELRTCLDID